MLIYVIAAGKDSQGYRRQTKCKIIVREYHLILPSFLPIYSIKVTYLLVPRALILFVFTVETRHRSKMFLAPFEGSGRCRLKGKLSSFATSLSDTLADFSAVQLFVYLCNGVGRLKEVARQDHRR